LSYEDEITTLKNGKIEWNKPIRIISSFYEGKMYKIEGDDFSLLISPQT
jgi:hypothetical protein